VGETMSVKKLIMSPTGSGILIGVLTLAGLVVMETWFPWIGQAWRRHKELVKAIWFTLALFVICTYRLWHWHRRNPFAFWMSIGLLFLLHVAGVLSYTILVQPILGWQWIILLVLEIFLIVSLVDWSTARFRRVAGP
jgi:hypothetical protein